MLEPLNIEARYPSHRERLMMSLTEARCVEIIDKTKYLQQWIRQRKTFSRYNRYFSGSGGKSTVVLNLYSLNVTMIQQIFSTRLSKQE